MPKSEFPGVGNVRPYAYNNENDYERWNNVQMVVAVCSVPWDLGEAHVGQRTIEGVGNVVYFEGQKARDAYFDGLGADECIRFETKYRSFHDDLRIKLPIPASALAQYNYIEVRYNHEPGTGIELDHYSGNVDRWYYFIRSAKRAASNTSICELMFDTWTTFIYSIEFSSVFLERGHYPVSRSDVDGFLSNPCENSDMLLAEDVTYGELTRARTTKSCVLNGSVMACVITSANAQGDWGEVNASSGWTVPVPNMHRESGAPAPTVVAMASGDLSGFLSNANSQAPQFRQTIQGVFFASADLLNAGDAFSLFGVSVCFVSPARTTKTVIDLDKSQWGYDSRYAGLAKLYTYPYSAIDVYSEDGDATRVHVEDTEGTIKLSAALSTVYPYIKVSGHLLGVGGGGDVSVTYRNTTAHTFAGDGRWYDTLMDWDVPIYGVWQSSATDNFHTYWDRQQTLTAAANAQSAANTTATNTRTSENASANLNITNASTQAAGNSSINATSNSAASTDTSLSSALNQAIQAWNAGYSRAATAAEIEGEQLQAAVGASAGVVGSAISGAASGGVVGAALGLVSGGISGANSMTNAAISANVSHDKTEAQISNTQSQVTATNNNNSERTANKNSADTSNTNTNNDVITTVAASTAAVGIANATRSYNSATNAASLEYSTQQSAVDNQARGARLGAPLQCGTPSGGDGVTKPMAAFATIVTQPDGAIKQAGDAFLRYGYALSRYVDFETFNVMPKFSFWQCSDMWLSGGYVPDAYMDQIRMLLFGGVTVWRDPADIGKTSIYDNV